MAQKIAEFMKRFVIDIPNSKSWPPTKLPIPFIMTQSIEFNIAAMVPISVGGANL